MSPKILFNAEDRYEISGRGTVFTGRCPIDLEDRSTFDRIVGHIVEIRGEDYLVKGIECYALARGPKIGEPIGLLVDGPRPSV